MEVKMNNKAKKITILTFVAVFAIATLAFAGWGRGYGHMMGYGGMGPGRNHMGGYGYDQRGYYGNLSEEEMAKLDQQNLISNEPNSSRQQRISDNSCMKRSWL
jgi:hypothetical protein